MFELYDTHCHIQSIGSSEGEEASRDLWEGLPDPDPDQVIAHAQAVGVTRFLCVGCDLEDSALAVRFAQKRQNCQAAVGIHPHEAGRFVDSQDTYAQLNRLIAQPGVVAVGECGLDYHYEHSSRSAQRRILELQLELAIVHNKPIIFHVREAFEDFWPIFSSFQRPHKPIFGVLHSFTDSAANFERALSNGLYLGVNGIATFTKSASQQELFRTIPLANLLLETDAPFLTPYPYRGKICEPYHIRVIAEYLARQRNVPVEVIAEATTQNAQRLFGG